MFVGNGTVFLKKKFLGKGTNANKIGLSEVHEIEERAHIESNLIEKLNSEPVEAY